MGYTRSDNPIGSLTNVILGTAQQKTIWMSSANNPLTFIYGTDEISYIRITGGASGGFGNAVFYENDKTVTQDYTITPGKNAISAGPITISDAVVVTIPDGSTWTIP